MNLTLRLAIGIAATLPFAACNEDPELVRKRGEQEAEMAKLSGEIALVEERLKNVPPDQSAELEAAKRETKKLEEEHKSLSAEVAELEAEHQSLKNEHEEYKRKYTVQ
jgi:septal ring factor EnvC (AmiA/AmiB activator)